MKKGQWMTRSGEIVKIGTMSCTHLYNCMRFLTGAICIDPVYNKKYTDKQMVMHIRGLTDKLKELEKEYWKRMRRK